MTDDATPPHDDVRAVAQLAEDHRRMRAEIGRVIIGQEAVVEQLLIGLFARGHVLLVGVPGLAKTLLVSTVARILGLSQETVAEYLKRARERYGVSKRTMLAVHALYDGTISFADVFRR